MEEKEGEIATFFNTEFSQPVVTGASLLFLGPLLCGWFLKVAISPSFFCHEYGSGGGNHRNDSSYLTE